MSGFARGVTLDKCLLSTYPLAAVASNAVFGCGYSGATCTMSVQPSMTTAATCQTGDITIAAGVSLTVPSPNCCN